MTNSKKTKTEKTEVTISDNLTQVDYSFNYLSPEHFYTIGKFFGLNPPKIESARVLYVGLGASTAAINFASLYPQAKVVGLCDAKGLIEASTKQVKDLGINNIELKYISFADILDSVGEFDYIICNGVFSRVSKEQQLKILQVMKKSLTKNGIAHVGYNTLPGWNIVKTFRDMMRYHASIFEKNEDKLVQAELFVKFMLDSFAEEKSPYARFLRDEARILQSTDMGYVWNEYLSEESSQFYFSDFMDLANDAGLSYLGDTHLPSMYTGNLPAKAFEQLEAIDDIVRTEQYMDFITNRRFRNTLLCHDNLNIDRSVSEDVVDGLFISVNMAPEIAMDKIDFTDEKTIVNFIFQPHNLLFSTSSPLVKALAYAFNQSQFKFLTLEEIKKFVASKCTKMSPQDIDKSVKSSLLEMIIKGVAIIRAVKPKIAESISAFPEIGKLALSQATSDMPYITNQLNDTIPVNIIYKSVMKYLDGKNDLNQIAEIIYKDYLSTDKFKLSAEGEVITDKEQQKKMSENIVNQTLNFCFSSAFLAK